MNSRDRVLAAFAHEEPDRVPAWCGASSGFWENAKQSLQLDDEGLRHRLGDDFRRVFAKETEADLDGFIAGGKRTGNSRPASKQAAHHRYNDHGDTH